MEDVRKKCMSLWPQTSTPPLQRILGSPGDHGAGGVFGKQFTYQNCRVPGEKARFFPSYLNIELISIKYS